jgi:Heterokaryon incompatibility protein (HET)
MPMQITEVEDRPLPTRLINIGSADGKRNPFLWECGGSRGCYAALSYCWGTSTPFTTQTGSYKDRLQGFTLDELPKTVRDAVVITRMHGLQFLRVDTLCIIQGDSSDWQRESSKMEDIYGNASITIAATASKDSSDGCFVRRTAPLMNSIPLRSVCSNSDEVGRNFRVRLLDSKSLPSQPQAPPGPQLPAQLLPRTFVPGRFSQDTFPRTL